MLNLDALNPPQRDAVIKHDGPVLVLAGAGSGKTRVITYRIAYLLQEGFAKPWEILAVTFTNKAASEMKSRVQSMLTGRAINDMTIGTFHSFGAKFLRRHGDRVGRTSNFTIYDDDDQKRLMKTLLLQQVSKEEAKLLLEGVRRFLERTKISLENPTETGPDSNHPYQDLFIELFQKYESSLRQTNAFDFDDLIAVPCQLLRKDKELLKSYRSQFRYVLIDEFQDTNFPQGELARLLTAPDGNITAVGDDDQSIYGWRGAQIGNILQFNKEYKNVSTFRLEQNYRSTQHILNVAHAVIKNNRSRHPKKLWTDRKSGDKPVLVPTNDDREEAEWTVSKIKELIDRTAYSCSDIVILYRTNAQSRTFEESLRQAVVPYVIVGGLRFYERKEVKDFLAYLRLLTNTHDIVSIQRIINLPRRGIGNKTIDRLHQYANNKNITLFEAVLNAEDVDGIGTAAAKKVKNFGDWILCLREFVEQNNLFKVSEKLLHESGLIEHYKTDEPESFETRQENLSELLNALKEYSFDSGRNALEDLEDFLQEVALVTDVDQWKRDDQAITLMTLHAAKGLEFPIVFLTGLEEGLFPLRNSSDSIEELEEERRLFYVGSTRAKDQLFLTYARNRRRWGQEIPWQKPSRFISEIPKELLQIEEDEFQPSLFSNTFRPSFTRERVNQAVRFKKEAPTKTQFDNYQLGVRVVHNTFGEGCIIHREGKGNNLRLLVNFESVGEKLLLANFAKLKILSN